MGSEIPKSSPEMYLGLCQTLVMHLFAKIVKSQKTLTIYAKLFIVDVWHCLKYTLCNQRKTQKCHLIYWCRNFVKMQFLQSFGRFPRNFTKTVSFHKNSMPGNQVKIQYFMQCSHRKIAIFPSVF